MRSTNRSQASQCWTHWRSAFAQPGWRWPCARRASQGSCRQGVDLSAYRIIQEALTNTLRHAGAVRAQVVVRYRGSSVELEIADDGTGPSADGSGGGQGLIGMRERVTMFGGELEAGSSEAGGFRVRALLPVEASPA